MTNNDTPEQQRSGDDLIEKWAPDVRDAWIEKGNFDDDFRGMFRTALLAIAQVREGRAKAEEARRVNQEFTKHRNGS